MKLSAKSRFTTIMVFTASVAMLVVGVLAWVEGRNSLRYAEFTILDSIRNAKSRQVEEYFGQMRNQLTLMSEDQTIVSAMVQLSRGYRLLGETSVPQAFDDAIQNHYVTKFIPELKKNLAGGTPEYASFQPKSQPGRYLQYHYLVNNPESADPGDLYAYDNANDGTDYSEYHEKYHKGLRDFLVTFGYYDVFLVDFDTAEIVYTVAKEVDFGTNLINGPYRNTGLAEVVRKVQRDPIRGQVEIVDFTPYSPSNNLPASFIAAPIFNGQHVVGIIAFQIPVDKIQKITTSNRDWKIEGMGETGETYIVGNDFLMRSDSRFLLEDRENYFDRIRAMGVQDNVVDLINKLNTTILLQPVQTDGARAALRGEEGHFVAKDYRGVSVLSAYGKIDIDGLDWGIVTEINQAEAFAPVGRLLRRVLISTAIFIPIVAYLSFLLSQGFMRPIRNMIDTAKSIRKAYGDESHEVSDEIQFKVEGAFEYQELADEMNMIMSSVRDDMSKTRLKQKEYTDLITAALPPSVGERLKSGETNITDAAKQASVLFIQIDNFDSATDAGNYEETLLLQNKLDQQAFVAARNVGVDIFTQTGMELVGVCGLTMPYLNHMDRTLNYCMQLFGVVDRYNQDSGADLQLNCGIDVGPLYGALQTGDVFDYDLIGDSISISREAGYAGPTDSITVTEETYNLIKALDLVEGWEKVDDTVMVRGAELKLWALSGDHIRKHSAARPA